MDMERNVSELLKKLSIIADILIIQNPENAGFMKDPDDPREHDLLWHQFGIITHTQKFLEAYESDIWNFLDQWGMCDAVRSKLSSVIGGLSKLDLLKIVIGLHDVGKFARGSRLKNGTIVPDYKGHEKKSEVIIRKNQFVQNFLRNDLGFSDLQIDYVASCAGLHFELGKARYAARETQIGYSFGFIQSRQFENVCREVSGKNEGLAIEIGILFLGDSLAKTDVVLRAGSDKEIQAQIPVAMEILSKKELDSRLISSIAQRPVNIAAARRYLELILNQ